MKKTKKSKFAKNKLMLSLCAVAMPIAATVASCTLCPTGKTHADGTASNYYASYVKEVSMTNNNFSSSSSTYSLSTSLSGWTGKLSNSNTTAGIITTGTSFQNYMSDTFYLSRNPGAKASDSSILMINSKTSKTGKNQTARQGYSSSTISLAANSYYSFQVSFKAETDYTSKTTYVEAGNIVESDKTITKSTFESKNFEIDAPVYVEYKIGSTTYYIQKTLTADATPLADEVSFSTEDSFYKDENYTGFTKDEKTFFVQNSDVSENEGTFTISAGKTTYSCNLTYNKANNSYEINAGEKYYSSKTEYTSLNDYIYGSMYLSGLKDKDGNPIKAEFTEVTSKDWVTFYFFVATGDEQQETSLDLWLGADREGYTSGGAVFFDDCHVFQYSENAFWKTYNAYANRNYEQESNGNTTKINCTKIFNLREQNSIDYSSHNFDFESGMPDNSAPVSNWTTTGTGKARIFNTGAPEAFKAYTGYDFVGSNLSCKVDIENGEVKVSKNDYVLGLSANKQYVKVTSNDIMIEANSIYKIKAYYKVSELSEGNVYMFVEESDAVLKAYNLTDGEGYKLLSQTASSGLTSNGSDQFTNNYGVVEFYVKGGALYNSAVKVSLGLGSETENATGCVVFDDVTVTKASSADFESATNKATLNENTATFTVSNGEFNNVTITDDGTKPLAPVDWTISASNDFTYGGVVNSAQSEYDKYFKAYNDNVAAGIAPEENPYYWASFGNSSVGNRFGNKTDTDNILMLANCKETWQKVQSPNISLTANSFNKISFWYNTDSQISVTLYDKSGFKLSQSKTLTSAGKWTEYNIFVKAGNGASEVYLVIELGTEKEKQIGNAYFDHFTLDSSVTEDTFNSEVEKKNNTIDMSNFYLNLPSNDITTDLDIANTPAYEGKVVAGNGGSGAIVSSKKFEESENFKIEGEETNVFYLQNQTTGNYALQSIFNIDLENNYYKLSFKLKTHFEGTLDSKKEYKYGVTIGLTGFDYMSELKSDEEYQEYSIYFHPSETTSTQLYISLISDAPETIGAAAIYDLKLDTIESSEYELASSTVNDKKYDVNKDRVSIANKSDDSTPDDDTNNGGDTETAESPSNGDLNWSILISSLLMAAAIVIAVVAAVMRNVKLKKIEKKRKESYDRKTSLEVDVVKAKAKAERDAEIAEVQKNVDRFQKELDSLEAKHKEKIVSLRSQDKSEVSKATDKEFKDFARKRTAVAEKIDSLKKQIENINSPEYLLELERKVYAQEIARKRQIEKASKKQNAKQEKTKAKEQKQETSKKSKKD